MFDPKSRLKALLEENKKLKEKLDRAQHELAESVRTEVELGVAIRRLSGELEALKSQKLLEKKQPSAECNAHEQQEDKQD